MKPHILGFSPIFKEKIWGGRAFEKLGKNLPNDKPFGESWEISAHPHGSSTIINGDFKGKTLSEVLSSHGEQIVGSEIWKKYKGQFPLLLKLLDVNDKLSIQVHPDDSYAIPNENSFGKAECWYILYASPDATLIMGMKEGWNKQSFFDQASKGNFDNMFSQISIQAGDLITICPGMVHANLSGSIFLVEVQQNSDITYRIYDFDRTENGVRRPLHIKQSADIIDFVAQADVKNFASTPNATLTDWKYFSMKKITIHEKKIYDDFPTMRLFIVIKGSVSVDGNTFTVGQSFLAPANYAFELIGNACYIESYPK
ncbi:MAG: type I phosphomannose isomerase catalytic subunit [Brevinema sp.]